METICPQCAKNHSEKSNQCSTNDEPLCINCDKGMDRHRADSIDCPQYRETMKISNETYQSHLKTMEIKNPAQNEQINEIFEMTKQNSEDIDNLTRKFENFIGKNIRQQVEMAVLVSNANSMDNVKFIERADAILNGKVSAFQRINKISIDDYMQIE